MAEQVIIDGNSLGYSANYAMKLRSGEQETQAVFGFLKSLREIRLEYPDANLLALWDGRAQWRFDAHPTYKSNRDNDPKKKEFKDSYVSQRPFIYRCLTHLGVRQLLISDKEADDCAGLIVNSLAKKPHNKIHLITGDEDWLQMVKENVDWRDWRDDAKQIDMGNFEVKTGYKTPLAFLEGKCLNGDTSDVIPGVGQIGEVRSKALLSTFGSVIEFWRQVDSGAYAPRWAYELRLASPEGRRRFMANLKLMQLLRIPASDPQKTQNDKGKFDKEAFAEVCEELSFVSILRTLDKFTEPFERHA